MMITRIVDIDSEAVDRGKIKDIARVLTDGGVIVYPTDTFYGLGANCFSPEAVNRIFLLKKRESAKPISVMISHLDMLQDITAGALPLFEEVSGRFWPGPLTLVLQASSRLPREILGAGDTIAVRWPDHLLVQEIVREAGFPLTATSANLSGEREIDDPALARQVFEGRVDIIIDGGKTAGGKPSTILDLTGDRPKVIREGAVPVSELRKQLDIRL